MSIEFKDTSFSYNSTSCKIPALKNINLIIKKSEFISIIGRNSSGKSTLGKLMNALHLPTEGNVFIDGLDTTIQDNLYKVRNKVGMVFQNPDNQIIGSTVEEDIAFGLENLGLELSVMHERIEYALNLVHLKDFIKISPHELSGGQKQRLAIAGVIAMRPEIIVFDEPTSLLDPKTAKEILNLIHILNKQHNITVIFITQNMEEILDSDRILVLNEGSLIMDGASKDILNFKRTKDLYDLGLTLPVIADISNRIYNSGIKVSNMILKEEEMIKFLMSYKKEKSL